MAAFKLDKAIPSPLTFPPPALCMLYGTDAANPHGDALP
jgi:hypothetical protein